MKPKTKESFAANYDKVIAENEKFVTEIKTKIPLLIKYLVFLSVRKIMKPILKSSDSLLLQIKKQVLEILI